MSSFLPEAWRELEERMREIVREEGFHAVNGRYPSWARNVPGERIEAAGSDQSRQLPADPLPNEGAGS